MPASSKNKYSKILAFPDTYYELIINLLQSVELFCAYVRKWQKIPGYEFLCSCAPCNCIKVRMFSAHSNLFLYSICMNKEKVGYIETTHCQSGSMVLFPAMRRKSAAVPEIWC